MTKSKAIDCYLQSDHMIRDYDNQNMNGTRKFFYRFPKLSQATS